MQTYLKTRPVWIQLLLFMGMAFGVFLVVSMIGVFILSKMTGIDVLAIRDVESWDASNPNIIIYIRGLLLIQFVALFVLPTLLFGYFSDPRPADYLGLKAKELEVKSREHRCRNHDAHPGVLRGTNKKTL